jgi:adenine deaminase
MWLRELMSAPPSSPARVDYSFIFLSAMLSVGVRVAALAQGAPLAITDVTVVDGTRNSGRPHMTVVISGGRIVAVDPVARAVIPSHATIIHGHGKFLIPGLWDMHVHLAKAGASSPGRCRSVIHRRGPASFVGSRRRVSRSSPRW